MKLFIIDGHALVFKMYYAFLGRPMINTKGVDTSILFGFTKYLLELIEKEHPTHLAVAFDPPGGSFRNNMYPLYKANRGETPQLVIDALEPLTAIVKSLNIPVVMIRGFEADDVIGSMACKFASDSTDVYMVTPDKDYGQLVRDHVFQFKPGKSGSENEILDSNAVCAKWDISSTSQVIDILAICGDASDNVPGVRGVGDKGAAKLLEKYGSVEGIYEHLDELTARQKEMFDAASGHIALSKQLVTIKTDIPIDLTLDDMLLDASDGSEFMKLCVEYEFNSLKKHIFAPSDSTAPATEKWTEPELAEEEPDRVFRAAEAVGKCAVMESGEKLLIEAAVSDAKNIWCIAGAREAESVLKSESIAKCGHSMKGLLKSLLKDGIEPSGRLEDCALLHYLINPERSHSLEDLARGYLDTDLETKEENVQGDLFGADIPEEGTGNKNLARQAAVVLKLAELLSSKLESRRLYDEVEEPLMRVLAKMEHTGVMMDISALEDFASGLRKSMEESERKVRQIAQDPSLNLSSPKQIGELVFEKLKLDPKAKKPSKGNWPADEETLSELSDRSPVIDEILSYRGTRKLLSTYIDPIPGYVNPTTGRVHTTFNQTLTSTGRLSSSNPNLQNIPIRTEQGREIRKAFRAQKPGWVMMSADYSQIELRVMAHISGDGHLCEAFRNGVDIHSATASRIFGVGVDDVTPDQRRMAKTANFGIMYGISAFGLSQRLKCPRSEASKLIDDYFASFPSIRDFINGTLSEGRRAGYVQTLFGRRRYVPDLNSNNGNIRALAERNAVNAPIQGTAADIIKMAMIAVQKELEKERCEAKMVLQIHDELLLEVPENEIEKVKRILTDRMQDVVSLSVPLTVECNYGKSWLEAH